MSKSRYVILVLAQVTLAISAGLQISIGSATHLDVAVFVLALLAVGVVLSSWGWATRVDALQQRISEQSTEIKNLKKIELVLMRVRRMLGSRDGSRLLPEDRVVRALLQVFLRRRRWRELAEARARYLERIGSEIIGLLNRYHVEDLDIVRAVSKVLERRQRWRDRAEGRVHTFPTVGLPLWVDPELVISAQDLRLLMVSPDFVEHPYLSEIHHAIVSRNNVVWIPVPVQAPTTSRIRNKPSEIPTKEPES